MAAIDAENKSRSISRFNLASAGKRIIVAFPARAALFRRNCLLPILCIFVQYIVQSSVNNFQE